MNSGIIANRYAKALLKYVRGTEDEDMAYSQASVLVALFQDVPKFRDAVERNPELSVQQRVSLLEAALQGQLCDSLKRFVQLVDSHSRMEFFFRMMVSFADQYREYRNIKQGSLVTAVHHDALGARLEEIMSNSTGAKVSLVEKVDDSLIGGFVLQVGDLRMDASVAGQFRKIRNALVDNDNRII